MTYFSKCFILIVVLTNFNIALSNNVHRKRHLHDNSVHFEEDYENDVPNTFHITSASVPHATSSPYKRKLKVKTVDDDSSVLCPQIGWKKIMETSIKPNDPTTSINRIQTGLSRHQRDGIFIVMCTLANQRDQIAKKFQFYSKGQKSCQLIKDQIWCHAIGLK
uniref:Ground-like domain-containing protein n=1 Tax=Globodera pallida TaxID=36090 RepID=A0A183C9Y1_GLOPA